MSEQERPTSDFSSDEDEDYVIIEVPVAAFVVCKNHGLPPVVQALLETHEIVQYEASPHGYHYRIKAKRRR